MGNCVACGTGIVEERITPFVVEYEGHRAEIQDRAMHCNTCDNVSYAGEQISAHEHAVASQIRLMLGLLTPDELKAIRSKYAFTQRDMERMLSTGAKTWVRWERGKVVQTKSADTLIRLLAQDFTLAHRLMLQAGIENPDADIVFAALYRHEHAQVVQVLKTLVEVNPDDVSDVADHLMHMLRWAD